MQIRIAALADYTNMTANGKLNILGIFSQIHAIGVPFAHLQMQLVIQFAFEPAEAGEKDVRILLQDADGKLVLSLDGTMSIPHPNNPDPVIVNQVLALQNVVFPAYGSYEFVIEVNGETLPVKVPLDVLPVAQSTQNQV